MTLRNLFPNETTEVGAFLYLQTNISENKKNAIQTLDNFLILIEKLATDDLAYNKLIEIINTYYSIVKSKKRVKSRRKTNEN